MNMQESYRAYLDRREALSANPFGEFTLHPEKFYIHPFRVYGNVWYVGDSWVCVHLIDTGEGLLLIDSGNSHHTALLVQAIWEAGFSPAEVRWIVHSHGHIDHIGGANFFRRMFGSKLLLSAEDAKMFREHPEQSFIYDSHDDYSALFIPDQEISDGDVLTFGKVTIQFYVVPGHAPGCIAFFFDAEQDGIKKRCGYFGGFGFNTLTKAYLHEIGDNDLSMRAAFLSSLERFMDEPVDIFLGNHTENNHTIEKRQMQMENRIDQPFIDSQEWRKYLENRKEAFIDFCASGQ